MVEHIAYIMSTGEISNISYFPSNPVAEDREMWNELLLIYIYKDNLPEGFTDPATFSERYLWSFETNDWVYRGPRPNEYYDWVDGAWTCNPTNLMDEIRRQRDYRLGRSDWSQFSDNPLSEEQKASWRTYRQTLRDIPSTVTDSVDHPDDLNWPDEPF